MQKGLQYNSPHQMTIIQAGIAKEGFPRLAARSACTGRLDTRGSIGSLEQDAWLGSPHVLMRKSVSPRACRGQVGEIESGNLLYSGLWKWGIIVTIAVEPSYIFYTNLIRY